jgi:hypothetical protein
MSDYTGFNPIRWKCHQGGMGCFNECTRFKIEELQDALLCRRGERTVGEAMGFTDIDGAVEIGGQFLFLEFKSRNEELERGQEIYYEQLTALGPRFTALGVQAQAKTSTVYAVKLIAYGFSGDWYPYGLALSVRATKWCHELRHRGP